MAVNLSLVIFAIVAFMAPTISLATDFVVGGDDGWKTGVDYDDWVKGKQFVVGDALVFKYKSGAHNVYKVDGGGFKSCNVPSNNSLGLFTGDDRIPLATAGNKWYICGVSNHCDGGMKLKITVLDSIDASTSTSSYAKANNFQIFLGIVFTIAAMIIIN